MPSPEASNDDVRGVAIGRVEKIISGGWSYSEEYGPDHRSYDPGQWHSLAPEAQAKRRDALQAYFDANLGPNYVRADAVLKALGLSDA